MEHSNNRLSVRQEQQARLIDSFGFAIGFMLFGVAAALLLFTDDSPMLWQWAGFNLLVISFLLVIRQLSRSPNRPQAHESFWEIPVLLLIALWGVAWGSLFGLVSDVLLQPDNSALLLSLLVTGLLSFVFAVSRMATRVLLATSFIPLLIYPVMSADELRYTHLALTSAVLILLIFGSAMFRNRFYGQLTQQQLLQDELQQLKRELQDLQVAFSAQDDAIKAETSLRQAVEIALRQANNAAEAANRAKTEFLATISHEIRTPLNGVLPILEMLSATELTLEQKQLVNTAFNSSTHLLRIINDILDFSKAEVGKLEIESLELDLPELVYSITDLMRQNAEPRGIAVVVNIADEVPENIRSDALRLRQILTNLLSNALKFTEQGTVTVEISKRSESRKEVELMFSVRDTGIGMADETANRLFHSFTQADASTTRKHGGTGLGLVICKRLVELMGGKIGVRSKLGEGSLFWFILPVRKSLLDVPAVRSSLEDIDVLVLESQGNESDLLQRIVKDFFPEAVITTSRQEITGKISGTSPGQKVYDILILDAMGSETRVVSLLQELKREASNPLLSYLVVNSLPHLRDDLHEAGANVVLDRPLNGEILRRQIYRLLDIEIGGTAAYGLPDSLEIDSYLDDLSLGKKQNGLKLPDHKSHAEFSGTALVVEDNPINLAVAKRMLQLQGLEVEVARDGLEALSQLEHRRFDLVFMDCLMPNLDGYEATGKIRDKEKEQGGRKHQVIIAMTANAMRGDRERCIAASMDDYLPKPINESAVREMLRKWLKQQPVQRESGDDSQPEIVTIKTSTGTLIDKNVLGELKDVMGEDFKQLIVSYLENAPQLLVNIKRAMDSRDIDEIIMAAHSLKSSSANVGASEVSKHALELEMQLRKGETEDLQERVNALIRSFAQAGEALREITEN